MKKASDGEPMKWLLDNYLAPVDGPCVVWPFGTDGRGYGQLRVGRAKIKAHVLALTMRDGAAPPGMEAGHGPCHSRLCIVHVTWKTHEENMNDRRRDGTAAIPKKLTETNVREIRQRRLAGETGVALATEYGVTPAMVTAIHRRRAWAWLD